jgi:hypothetical protein
MGENCATAKSINTISTANKAPAIGALKAAAIPAAAPHPTSVFNLFGETLRNCPTTEPRLEPICIIGHSLPTDPPVPIVIAEASALIMATLPLI